MVRIPKLLRPIILPEPQPPTPLPVDSNFIVPLVKFESLPLDFLLEEEETNSNVSIDAKPENQTFAENPVFLPAEIKAESDGDFLVLDPPKEIPDYLDNSAVNSYRPEIIGVFDLKMFGSRGGEKTFSEFLSRKRNIKDLYEESAKLSISAIKNIDRVSHSKLKQKYEIVLREVKQSIEVLATVNQAIKVSKLSFDIRNNQKQLADLTFKHLSNLVFQKENDFLDTEPTIENMFVNDLKFSEKGFKKFSNSKILRQLYLEAKNLASLPTFQNLPGEDVERKNDEHPTKLFRTSGERSFFHPSLIDQKTQFMNDVFFDAHSFDHYSTFLSSLPDKSTSKIRLLVNFLQREFTISSGIGWLSTKDLGKRFNPNLGDPFDLPFGDLGIYSFDLVAENIGLSNFVCIGSNNEKVLPFESRKFIDENGIGYQPGTDFFFDQMFESDEIDISQYKEFSKSFTATSNDVAEYLNHLLNLRSVSNNTPKFTQIDIYKKFLKKLKKVIEGSVGRNFKHEDNNIIAAVFKIAQTDFKLRHLLLSFLLEMKEVDDVISEETSQNNIATFKDTRDKSVGAFFTDRSTRPSRKLADKSTRPSNLDILRKPALTAPSDGNIAVVESEEGSSISSKKFRLIAQRIAERTVEVGKAKKRKRGKVIAVADNTVVIDNPDVIRAAFEKINSDNSAVSDIFTSIFDVFDWMKSNAEQVSNRDKSSEANYLTENGHTLYNKIDQNAVLMVIFEIFAVLITKFVSAEISGSSSRRGRLTKLETRYNTNTNKKLSDDIDEILETKEVDYNSVFSFTSSTNSLVPILSSFRDETRVLKTMVAMIRSVGTAANFAFDNLLTFLKSVDGSEKESKPTTRRLPRGTSKKPSTLKNVYGTDVGRDMLKNLDDWKVVSYRWASEKNRARNEETFFSSDTSATKDELDAMNIMFKQSKFSGKAGSNVRNFIVGIPGKFLDNLMNPPYFIGEESPFQSPKSSVIEVCVYRQDLENDGIYFKPIKYLFDTSVFLLPETGFSKKTTSQPTGKSRNNSFSSLVKGKLRFSFIDASGISSADSVDSLVLSSRYRNLNLSNNELVKMYENHATDFLFKLYYQYFYGLNVNEGSFLSKDGFNDLLIDLGNQDIINSLFEDQFLKNMILPGAESIDNFVDQVSLYGEDFLSVHPEDLITRNSVRTIIPTFSVEKYKNFRSLMKSRIFSQEVMARETFSPKLFDRVLVVPVDQNDFVLDTEKTKSTELGKALLANKGFRENIKTTVDEELNSFFDKYQDFVKSENDYSFNSYFVDVNIK